MTKVIALYLPQYHPTPDNDKWWGEGFTEWTNVAKAKRLYKGHYQPRIPANLGFYDLRLPEVRLRQAELARMAGVSAFCYYHYWFGNGKMELERPFEEVLASGQPDFPFCLCWANESWYSKQWNQDGTLDKQLLCEQLYPGENDNLEHFRYLLPAFLDPRYLRYKGKPIFMIYDPLSFKGISRLISQWNALARENGLEGIHFVAHVRNPRSIKDIQDALALGFDAVNVLHLDNFCCNGIGLLRRGFNFLTHRLMNRPYINDYSHILDLLTGSEGSLDRVYPSLVPNWDHTPRSGRGGYLFENCEPALFEKHCIDTIRLLDSKPEEDRIVFLKSWNEWGEGNYMEPDLRYGLGYIEALRRALDKSR